VIGLAHANGEKLLDVIPLNEIISIQDCDGIGSADADDGAGRILLEIALTVLLFNSEIEFELLIASVRIETQTECCPKFSILLATITQPTKRTNCKRFSEQSTPTGLAVAASKNSLCVAAL
jgi:hypothetical protein